MLFGVLFALTPAIGLKDGDWRLKLPNLISEEEVFNIFYNLETRPLNRFAFNLTFS